LTNQRVGRRLGAQLATQRKKRKVQKGVVKKGKLLPWDHNKTRRLPVQYSAEEIVKRPETW